MHIPGEEVRDRHQAEKAFLKRDLGDISGPPLVHCHEHAETHQAGEPLGWMTRDRSAQFLEDRPKAHAPHVALLPVSADLDSISGQVAHHPAAAAEGILQLESIDPGHDPHCRFPTGLGRQYSVNRARPSRAHCQLPLSSG